MSEFCLTDAIRDVLATSKRVDPHKLAFVLMGRIPSSEVDRLVHHSLADLIRKEISEGRSRPHRPGVSRWQRHRIAVDGLGDRIYVGGDWKWLAVCTAVDLEDYAAEQSSRAAALQTNADKAAALAEQLREAGVETVADLFAATERVAA